MQHVSLTGQGPDGGRDGVTAAVKNTLEQQVSVDTD